MKDILGDEKIVCPLCCHEEKDSREFITDDIDDGDVIDVKCFLCGEKFSVKVGISFEVVKRVVVDGQ